MKVIKNKDAIKGKNAETCKTLEYCFGDSDIDLGIATITGRYPETGYAMNLISKELIYVIQGGVNLHFANEKIELLAGDSMLIQPKEKYFLDGEYGVISMACTPAWSSEQHKLVM